MQGEQQEATPLTERLKPLCCGIMIPLKGIATAVGQARLS